MKSFFSCLSLCALVSIGTGTARADIIPLSIISLVPKPNYKLTTNGQEPHQLVDGLKNNYPIWASSSSAGWAHQAEVIVTLQIGTFVDQAQLKVYSAFGEKAGVNLPRRIDAYSTGPSGNTSHIGSYQSRNTEGAGRNATIEIPLKIAEENTLQLVFRANGSFLMIDEIELVDTDEPPENFKEPEVVNTDILSDARSRYRQAVIDRWNSKQRDVGDKGLTIVDPWEKYPWSAATSLEKVERIEAFGNYLGLVVNGYQKLSLRLEAGQVAQQLGLYSVSQVLTGAEEFIYDPLYVADSTVGLAVNNKSFFLIDLSSVDQTAKGSKLVTEAWFGDERKYKEFPIDFGSQEVGESCKPFAMNFWAYDDDQPIWNDKERVRDYLEGLGDYVAVISPRTLGIGSVPVATQIARLKRELKFYRNSKHILVYLAWDKLYAQGVDKPKVVEWVKQAQNAAFELGIDSDRWALYPVDEVNRERYPLLLELLQVIKTAAPDLQTFANPILPATRSNRLSVDHLKSLNAYVNIWQPEMRLASRYNAFFLESRKLFWVYENPEYPAKSASPEWYYNLPQRAHRLGASGVGFWSFSDTSKTSAWDDLDGKRADWAVVYESKTDNGELILSRRWLAFLAGINEVRPLRCSSDE